MKSALELAMEKTKNSGGEIKPLTPEQKEAIAERRRVGEARIAELQLAFDEKMKGVSGRPEFNEKIAEERKSLLEERERIEQATERDVADIKNR